VEDTNGVSFVPALLCIPVAGGVTADDGVNACIFLNSFVYSLKTFFIIFISVQWIREFPLISKICAERTDTPEK
jgi:hypothetical protein